MLKEQYLKCSPPEILREKPYIAIAGASGRIGKSLQAAWGPKYELTALKHASRLLEEESLENIVEGFDITDSENVRRTADQLAKNGVTVFINSTGIVNVDSSEKERGDTSAPTYRVNFIGAQNLARTCREFNLRLIHLSTEYVFDGQKSVGEKYTEEDKPNMDFNLAPTWYGLTKAWAERVIKEEYPQGSTIVRISQVQGVTSGLFNGTLRQLAKGEPFTRSNDQQVAPITSRTLARALELITNHSQQGPMEIYHVGATDSLTSYQTAIKLADAYGMAAKAVNLITPTTLAQLVFSGEQKVVRPKNAILAVGKFQRQFGDKILGSIEDEIRIFKSMVPDPLQ